MTTIKVDITDRSIVEALRKLRGAGEQTDNMLREIGSELRTLIHLGFDKQADPWGRPWKPIKRPGQILRDTGRLLNSITYRIVGKDRVEVGTNVEYGVYHQFFTIRKSKKGGYKTMPARPFLPIRGRRDAPFADLPPEWERSILSIINEAVAI